MFCAILFIALAVITFIIIVGLQCGDGDIGD